MTRPNLSALVLDGQKIKLRLQADRASSTNVCHVDWLRFTCQLRDAPFDIDLMFPPPLSGGFLEVREARVSHALKQLELEELYAPAAQALTLAQDVATILGASYEVDPTVKKGHDFYSRRWSINLNGAEVGWVGFGASSDSPKQQAQAKTIHCNLYGAACTFAAQGWRPALADKLDQWQATITRVDLAVDFFDGFTGGLDAVKRQYETGLCDVGGKRPKCNMVGDWVHGHDRSFYIGSKQAGKQTNCYEKGDQLFGVEAGSPWVRFELRYGNKLRELSTNVLRDPDAFFAGASDWHASIIGQLATNIVATPIKTTERLQDETVDSALSRFMRWFRVTAAPSLMVMVKHGATDWLADMIEHVKYPRRLQGYLDSQINNAFQRLISPAQRMPDVGLAL